MDMQQDVPSQRRKRILLGTENPAKQERLVWLLEGSAMEWVTPKQVPLATPEIQEGRLSHQANARAKAVAWSRAYHGLAMATDGGLVIPALGRRWNSLRSRRFSSADDVGRAHQLLALMAPLTGPERRASWREALAVAEGGCLLDTFLALSGEGYIAHDICEPLVKDGFWVGAIWCFSQVGNKCYAQLNAKELREVGDHWMALKEKVQRFFR